MCDLCSKDRTKREKAQADSRYTADRLQELANAYRHIANGELNPHGEESKKVVLQAKMLIRVLVDEWV